GSDMYEEGNSDRYKKENNNGYEENNYRYDKVDKYNKGNEI
ncbi:9808_t:CDS:1, partial [Cetraspora pellucida]